MTLQERWDDLQTIIQRRSDNIFNSAYGSVPAEFYNVYPTGSLEVRTTIGIYYQFPFATYFSGKKPTQKDVDRLTEDLYKPFDVSLDKIYLNYSASYGDGHTSKSASKARDLFNEKSGLFFDKERAEAEAMRVSEKWKADRAWDELHKKTASYDYNGNGYKFLGWQNSWAHVYFDTDGNITNDPDKRRTFGYRTEDYPEYGACRDAKHRTVEVSHNNRGSEHTVSCPICKIYYKYDSSD